VPLRAVPVAWKLSTTEERLQDQSCLLQRGDYTNTGRNIEKLAWVRVPVRAAPVVRKLSTIEERHQDRVVSFEEDVTGTQA
jgi:hypothetical protein